MRGTDPVQVVEHGKTYPGVEIALRCHEMFIAHAYGDGNKRLALAGVIAFYGMNGRRLTLTNDAAYELVMAVAAGTLDTIAEITEILRAGTETRG